MKRILTTLLLLLALVSASDPAFAQDPSTQGKEFWLSLFANGYQYNGGNLLHIQLLVSAKRDCQGTISNPGIWTHHFNVQADSIFAIDIDPSYVYLKSNEYERAVNKALKITTTDTVSVYCANIAYYSFDVSYVLPIEGLADDYIIQTYDQDNDGDDTHTSAFIIVATENNTTIDITPSVKTLGNKPAHQEFTITLDKGQAYQVRSHYDSDKRDLSGTRITARDCKKIAVFNGNTLTRVPTTANDDADCIFEQAMPIRSWGKKFVITSSLDREKDYVKVTSAADGNVIRRNGNTICTLNAGESFTFMLSAYSKSCYIEADQRCAVYLYNTSWDGGFGAPSMVWIAPIEQRVKDITFSTFKYDTIATVNNHYVNIIVESQDVNRVYFDNELLPPDQFEAVEGSTRYKFFRKKIDHGVHQLRCPNGFNAHIYGFGRALGYAYMAGSKAADLSTSILVNDDIVTPYDTIVDCSLESITFLADINLIDYSLEWNFGDGTTSSDNPVSHRYTNNDIYEASLTITTEAPPCGGTSTTTIYPFYVDSRRENDIEVYDTVCFAQPGIYTENDFHIPYEAPGYYEDAITVVNASGCLSHKNLHLTVKALTNLPTEQVSLCDSLEYKWQGHTYYISGHYTDTVSNETGCCVHHLELNLDHRPHPMISSASPYSVVFDDTVAAVITNTEFFSFQYDFYVEDTLGHLDDWDSYEWHISKPSWMIIPYDSVEQPNRHYCKVYVAEHINDYVKLWCTCTVDSNCQPDSAVAVFYLKSSFFGIEGHEASTSDFSVAPNPNEGSMNLHFENLSGRIGVKVYDMRGTLVDYIETNNASCSTTLPHTLKYNAPGIYFFVATAKEGTIARKVVVGKQARSF